MPFILRRCVWWVLINYAIAQEEVNAMNISLSQSAVSTGFLNSSNPSVTKSIARFPKTTGVSGNATILRDNTTSTISISGEPQASGSSPIGKI